MVFELMTLKTFVDFFITFSMAGYDGVDYWVGGSDILVEGAWQWIDGSPVAMGAPFWGGVSKVYFNLKKLWSLPIEWDHNFIYPPEGNLHTNIQVLNKIGNVKTCKDTISGTVVTSCICFIFYAIKIRSNFVNELRILFALKGNLVNLTYNIKRIIKYHSYLSHLPERLAC